MAILLLLNLLVPTSGTERRNSKRKGGKPPKLRKTIKTTIAPTVSLIEDAGEDANEIDPNEDAVWVPTVLVSQQPVNLCPPELRYKKNGPHRCVCRDGLDNQALMVECVALASANEMHEIFHGFLLGKKIDAIEVRNSTLSSMIPQMTGQSYVGSIWMRSNEITSIDNQAFRGTEQNIKRLDLGANQLTSVNFSMFDAFSQLQVLNLGENQLRSIENAGNAPSLRVLYLNSNKIKIIGPKAFYGLEALEYLDLRWNLLQVISSAAFQVSSHRWQLRLRSNQISTLENAFGMGNFPYLVELHGNNVGTLTDTVYGPLAEVALLEGSKIYLGENSVNCDCSIGWLANNVTLLSTIVGAKCNGNGIPISDIKFNDLRNCPLSKI